MEALYNWIRNLTCYLIFVTVIINLLPDKKYEKYLRFFFGMVFLLLVIQPFTRGFRIEEKIAYYFSTISLQNEAADFQKELLGADTVRLEQMLDRYEKAVAEDISQLAESGGFQVVQADVSLGRTPDSQDFGKVVQVRMVLIPMDETDPAGVSEIPLIEPIAPVVPVEPVVIGSEAETETRNTPRENDDSAEVAAFRRQLLNYYDLEENNVEIQVQNKQRQVDSAPVHRADTDDPGSSD